MPEECYNKDRICMLENRVSALERIIDSLTTKIDILDKSVDKLASSVDRMSEIMTELTVNISRINGSSVNYVERAELHELSLKINALEEKLKEREAVLNRQYVYLGIAVAIATLMSVFDYVR